MSDSLDQQRIFEEALALPAGAERDAHLAQQCEGRPELRQWIELLLEGDQEGEGFLKTEALDGERETIHIAERPGVVIGRYKILQQIGEGGFGVVYMAEQQEPVVRKVALKIIKPGMDTKQVVARFESERQALALMDHSNIAKVLDGGATESGRPYFVMELVSGISISKYCDESNTSTEQRLRLFGQVCDAVQHAHQKGVIHRDLKPSNILVTLHGDRPVPKVIDFGIAKATQQRLTEKTLFTQFQHFIGTPAYMSPEQASLSGLDIDTRSDVYSLGVLLYELLVGQTPFDTRTLLSKGIEEVRRVIREEEAPRPSQRLASLTVEQKTATATQRRATVEKLRSLVQGELDWIVMKAIEKDRTLRYESARSLAEDVDRFLANEPVTAAAPSRVYLAKKFYRRHRVALATLALFIGVLVVTSTISVWQAIQANQARGELSSQLGITEAAKLAAQENEKRALSLERSATENLELLWLQRGHQALEDERPEDAVAWMAWAARSNPTNRLFIDNLVATLLHGGMARAVTPPMRHEGTIISIAYSPDGTRLVTGAEDGIARIWDLATGAQVGEDLVAADAIEKTLYSPDGSRILLVSKEGPATVWDAGNGRFTGVSVRHEQRILHASFDPSGDRFVTASLDHTAQVWSTTTGDPVGPPLAHGDNVYWAEFSLDGGRLVTASADRTAILWDAVTLDRIEILPHDASVDQASFSRDSRWFLTQVGTVVRVWDSTNGAAVAERTYPLTCVHSIFSPSGEEIVTRLYRSEMRIWRFRDDKERGPFEHPTGGVTSIALRPTGGSMGGTGLTTGTDGSSRLWHLNYQYQLLPVIRERASVSHGEFSPDGLSVALVSAARSARVWSVRATTAELPGFNHGVDLYGVRLSPDGGHVFTSDYFGRIRKWNHRDASYVSETQVEGSTGAIRNIELSPDGERALFSGLRKAIRIWNTDSWEPIGEPMEHRSRVEDVLFTRDGRQIATRTKGNTVHLWDGLDGSESLPALSFNEDVRAIDWSPDGSQLAICSGRSVTLLRTGENGWGRSELIHPSDVQMVDFSPDSQVVATGTNDDYIRLWSSSTGEQIGDPMSNGIGVETLAFSPNDRHLVSVSANRQLLTWDWRRQQLIKAPAQLVLTPRRLDFNEAGDRLLVSYGGYSQGLQLYDVATQVPIGPPVGRATSHSGVDFSLDGRWIAATERGRTSLYEVPNSSAPVPPLFFDLAEALAGQRVTTGGIALEPIPYRVAQSTIQDCLGKAGDGYYGRLMRWLTDEPGSRTMTPNSEVTFEQYEKLLSDQSVDISVREWVHTSPTNGVAYARLVQRRIPDGWHTSNISRQRQKHYLSLAEHWAPSHPETKIAKAMFLQRRGDLATAAREIEFALEIDPSLGRAWAVKGEIELLRGRKEDALVSLNQAVVLGRGQSTPRHDYTLIHRSPLEQAEWLRGLLLLETGDVKGFQDSQEETLGIPPRSPSAPSTQLDLSTFYWSGLAQPWWRDGAHLGGFASVRESILDGVQFDARGVIHLYGRNDDKNKGMQFPMDCKGIPVGRQISKMHVLHSGRDSFRHRVDHDVLAWYTLVYEDGSRHDFPVRERVEVADCFFYRRLPEHRELNQRLGMVWSGESHSSGHGSSGEGPEACVFKTTFTNPHPRKRVESLELSSAGGRAGVMVLGITVE